MVVVLPAPLGPSRLKISPSWMSNEMPLTAVEVAVLFDQIVDFKDGWHGLHSFAALGFFTYYHDASDVNFCGGKSYAIRH